jgi:hypothetical protein
MVDEPECGENPSCTVFLTASEANKHAKEAFDFHLSGTLDTFSEDFPLYDTEALEYEWEEPEDEPEFLGLNPGARLWHSQDTKAGLFHGMVGKEFPGCEISGGQELSWHWTVTKLEVDKAYPPVLR